MIFNPIQSLLDKISMHVEYIFLTQRWAGNESMAIYNAYVVTILPQSWPVLYKCLISFSGWDKAHCNKIIVPHVYSIVPRVSYQLPSESTANITDYNGTRTFY